MSLSHRYKDLCITCVSVVGGEMPMHHFFEGLILDLAGMYRHFLTCHWSTATATTIYWRPLTSHWSIETRTTSYWRSLISQWSTATPMTIYWPSLTSHWSPISMSFSPIQYVKFDASNILFF